MTPDTPDPTASAKALAFQVLQSIKVVLPYGTSDRVEKICVAALTQAYNQGVADEHDRQLDPLGH